MAGLQHDTSIVAGLAETQKHEHDHEYPVEKEHVESIAAVESEEDYNDGIHDGLIPPTEEERQTLRRVADSIPWNAYLIAVVELAERFSFYGSSVVFTNFIQWPLPPGSHTGAGGLHGQSGALNMGQRASTGLTTFYQFWCYIVPLFGAYVADSYWGRYKTITYSVGVALLGHILMVISAVPGVIDKKSAIAPFILSLLVTGFGTGGFKANISPLVAEQYKRTKLFVITLKSGERVIVDPVHTTSRIYMYFYLFINIGALIGQIGMVYAEKFVGFWLAYALPTIIFLLCPLILVAGRNKYARTPPTGSVLASAVRYWRFCAKGKWSINPVKTIRQLNAPGFWDNAKPSKQTVRPDWMHFDDQWADEVKRGFKACAVFLWFPIYWLTYNQLNNNLTSQAATMDTHGLPNDVLSNLDPFALIILIPIFDAFIYPGLRRMGINFSPLKRITAGFLTGTLAMVWAAVVQHQIYKKSPCGTSASECLDDQGNLRVAELNVWIQSGSYILIAISEIFASITGLEYAFTKAPKNMRSLVMSVFLFMSAISSALGEAFVSLSADPLLVWNYGVAAIISGVATILFWISVRNLDAQEEELNLISEGHLVTEKNRD